MWLPEDWGFGNMSAMCKLLNLTQHCTIHDFDKGTDEEIVTQEHKSLTQLAVVVVTTCVVALLGNTVVLLAHRRKTRFRSYFVWLNILACSDIFSAVFILLHYVPHFWTPKWIYGVIGCKVISSAISIGAYVAIGSVFIISVERLIGIRYPFRNGMTDRTVWCLFLVNVVVAVVVVLPRGIIVRTIQEQEHGHAASIPICMEDRDTHANTKAYGVIYAWFVFVLYTATPAILMTLIFITVLITLRLRLRVLSGKHNAAAKLRREQQNRHTMLLLATVSLAFVLFTLPGTVQWLWSSMSKQIQARERTRAQPLANTRNPKRENLFRIFSLVSEAMYPFHVAANPFIYTACDRSFRGKVRTILGPFLDRFGCAMMAYRQWVLRFLYNTITCLYGFKFRRCKSRDPVTFTTRFRSSTKSTMLQESPTVTPIPKPRTSEPTTTGL